MLQFALFQLWYPSPPYPYPLNSHAVSFSLVGEEQNNCVQKGRGMLTILNKPFHFHSTTSLVSKDTGVERQSALTIFFNLILTVSCLQLIKTSLIILLQRPKTVSPFAKYLCCTALLKMFAHRKPGQSEVFLSSHRPFSR